MGRRPCCSKEGLKRGAWTAAEDQVLMVYVKLHGAGQWGRLPEKAGLKRCGKSCRLRWMNYLRPGIQRGNISQEEEDLIIRLHKLLGNRWALIAGRLPGRTDNEIKNYWNTSLGKKVDHLPNQIPRDQKHSRSKTHKSNSSELQVIKPPAAEDIMTIQTSAKPEATEGPLVGSVDEDSTSSNLNIQDFTMSDLINSDFSNVCYDVSNVCYDALDGTSCLMDGDGDNKFLYSKWDLPQMLEENSSERWVGNECIQQCVSPSYPTAISEVPFIQMDEDWLQEYLEF